MKKILLTGKDGQVGWELQHALAPLGQVFAYDRSTLDLADPDAIIRTIREIKPDIVVNAAAYTAVDKAETEQESAYAVNGVAPGVLAEESKRCGALLIHYSTDYVFDGTATRPYLETDQTNPLNVYGQSKLAGERAIQSVGGKYLIFRTSWVYGMRGKNFLLTLLKLAQEKAVLRIVGDQIGAPTWSRTIAEATAGIIKKDLTEAPWGVYHLTCQGETSWHGFAQEIFEMRRSQFPDFKVPVLEKITSEEYPTPARRPLYSTLSNEKIFKNFQIKTPHWSEALHSLYEIKTLIDVN